MSELWIKICGLTTDDAVAAALECGVDAVGFVFASSVRSVHASQAATLARPARGRAKCVAVMRHPTQTEVDEVLAAFKPDILQTDHADFDALHLPSQLERLPVFRPAVRRAPLPARLLFEGPTSGAGLVTDWTQAASLATRCELVLAGGLSAANIGDALKQVRPFGVDVSSGVEDKPGLKSRAKIADFVERARAGLGMMEEVGK